MVYDIHTPQNQFYFNRVPSPLPALQLDCGRGARSSPAAPVGFGDGDFVRSLARVAVNSIVVLADGNSNSYYDYCCY